MSIQLVSTCAARGVGFSVREVFECRTVGRLAEVAEMSIDARHAGELHASDLTLDKFIDARTLAAAPTLPRADAHVRTVLLTGATGFLGRFLALEWLERLDPVGGKLICLVRAGSNEEARRRLDSTFDTGDPELWAHYCALAANHLEVRGRRQGRGQSRAGSADLAAAGHTVDMIVDSARWSATPCPTANCSGPTWSVPRS